MSEAKNQEVLEIAVREVLQKVLEKAKESTRDPISGQLWFYEENEPVISLKDLEQIIKEIVG